LNVVRNVGGSASIRAGRHIRLSDDAVNASKTLIDLGWIHCHSNLADLDVKAIFYFLNDSGDHRPGLLKEVFFRIGEGSEVIGSKRHVLISTFVFVEN
jgi:stress response protein SCP2